MAGATIDAATEAADRRVTGYLHNKPVPHWSKLLPGAGGVEASINDVTAYLRAQLDPAAVELEVALEMTQRPISPYNECLGWQRAGSMLWHNGGTGGFSTFVGVDRGAGKAVGVLANMGSASALVDGAGFRALGVEDPLLG
jgi:CubicO group peptidase (beta-lactamase class C family)